MKFLNNKKTYLGFIGLGVTGILNYFGVIDDEALKLLLTLIGTWTGVSIRLAVKKVQDKA